MNSARDTLVANLAAVEARICAACARASRERAGVALVAVTKAVPDHIAAMLPNLGILDLGENRPQALWRKADLLPTSVRWHLIGHLQRNKIERTLPLVHRIHSVDSTRLLTALDSSEQPRAIEVFLEVNCSGESAKQGFRPDEMHGLASLLRSLRNVRVVGLMTMAAHEDDPQSCRPTFALLRQVCDELRSEVGDVHPLMELSMGMSNDFEVAIEEGATAVRLGTVLFTGLPLDEEAVP